MKTPNKKSGIADNTKVTVSQIIIKNIFTLFNLLNFFIAFWILYVGAYKNLTFMGVVISNTLIGIIQEIKAKHAVDKFALITNKTATLLKNDGQQVVINSSDVKLGDIIVLRVGEQICADAVVAEGEISVDNSMLTGEANRLRKSVGDELYCGSFVTSGVCRAKVTAVGTMCFSAKITASGKKKRKTHSPLLDSIRLIIKIFSCMIVPLSCVLFYIHFFVENETFNDTVVKTAAASIGMIPEGLVLLTSITLVVSVIRLSAKNVLVSEMFAIENLARADTVCFDKTGTLTTSDMILRSCKICKRDNKKSREFIKRFFNVLDDNSKTFLAVKNSFEDNGYGNDKHCICTIPFSSERKWSSIVFEDIGTLVFGAYDVLLTKDITEKENIEKDACGTDRVLVLIRITEHIIDENIDFRKKSTELIAVFYIEDELRPNVKESIEYLEKQGVDIKIISGDNPKNVSNIALNAGVKNADKFIDMSKVKNTDKISDTNVVFGRVSPEQKQEIIAAFKKKGRVCAMIGDGVNDVMALREANCSISPGSGSDAAKNVSQLIISNDGYKNLSDIISEGRRVINNIQRTAVLFLTKTFFSVLMTILTIVFKFSYPFIPIQMTLIGVLSIGIPSYILALEPNFEIIRGTFVKNVLSRTIPGTLTLAFGIAGILWYCKKMNISDNILSTVCAVYYMSIMLLTLSRLCNFKKFHHVIMLTSTAVLFTFALTFFGTFFSFARLTAQILIMCGFFIVCGAAFYLFLLKLFKQVFINLQ